jgi:hypothetical protein
MKPLGELGDVMMGSPEDQQKGGGTKTFPFLGGYPGDDNAMLTAGGRPATGLGDVMSSEMQQLAAILAGQ